MFIDWFIRGPRLQAYIGLRIWKSGYWKTNTQLENPATMTDSDVLLTQQSTSSLILLVNHTQPQCLSAHSLCGLHPEDVLQLSAAVRLAEIRPHQLWNSAARIFASTGPVPAGTGPGSV